MAPQAPRGPKALLALKALLVLPVQIQQCLARKAKQAHKAQLVRTPPFLALRGRLAQMVPQAHRAPPQFLLTLATLQFWELMALSTRLQWVAALGPLVLTAPPVQKAPLAPLVLTEHLALIQQSLARKAQLVLTPLFLVLKVHKDRLALTVLPALMVLPALIQQSLVRKARLGPRLYPLTLATLQFWELMG